MPQIDNTHNMRQLTLAVGSVDLIARNAAKEAVPPPINRYCTLSGIELDTEGICIILRDFFSKLKIY